MEKQDLLMRPEFAKSHQWLRVPLWQDFQSVSRWLSHDNMGCQISGRIQKISSGRKSSLVNGHSAETSKIGHPLRKQSVSKIEIV